MNYFVSTALGGAIVIVSAFLYQQHARIVDLEQELALRPKIIVADPLQMALAGQGISGSDKQSTEEVMDQISLSLEKFVNKGFIVLSPKAAIRVPKDLELKPEDIGLHVE